MRYLKLRKVMMLLLWLLSFLLLSIAVAPAIRCTIAPIRRTESSVESDTIEYWALRGARVPSDSADFFFSKCPALWCCAFRWLLSWLFFRILILVSSSFLHEFLKKIQIINLFLQKGKQWYLDLSLNGSCVHHFLDFLFRIHRLYT